MERWYPQARNFRRFGHMGQVWRKANWTTDDDKLSSFLPGKCLEEIPTKLHSQGLIQRDVGWRWGWVTMKYATCQQDTEEPREANSAGMCGQRLRKATVPSQEGGTALINARLPRRWALAQAGPPAAITLDPYTPQAAGLLKRRSLEWQRQISLCSFSPQAGILE